LVPVDKALMLQPLARICGAMWDEGIHEEQLFEPKSWISRSS